MAFVPEFACGFEVGILPVNPSKIFYGVNSGKISSTVVHTGRYSASFNNVYAPVKFGVSPNRSNLDLTLWLWPYTTSTVQVRILMLDGKFVDIRRNTATNHWDFHIDDVLAVNGSVATVAGSWQHIQIRATIDVVGSFETRIDGIPDISFNGNTIPGANDTIEFWGVFPRTTASNYIDDVVHGQGGWPNDLRIDPLYPSADTATIEWNNLGGGDNYEDVDSAPPSIPYIYTDIDATDIYELDDWDDTDGMGNVIKDPIAVTNWTQVRKEDGTRDDKISFIQTDGANIAQSAMDSILTTYQNIDYLRLLTPSGGAWSKADIDGLEVGVEADMV